MLRRIKNTETADRSNEVPRTVRFEAGRGARYYRLEVVS